MSLKSQLQIKYGYAPLNTEAIQKAYLEGDQTLMFALIFNSIENTGKYLENIENFYNLYLKYPEKKSDFLEFFIENAGTPWSRQGKEIVVPKWIDEKEFEEYWGMPFSENSAPIFQIIPKLDSDSKKLLFKKDNWTSPLELALAYENDDQHLFKPYKFTIGEEPPSEQELTLIDHIFFNFIKKENYQDAVLFYPIFKDTYSSTLSAYVSIKEIEELKIINYKKHSVFPLDSTEDIHYCKNLTELAAMIALDEPLFLEVLKGMSYQGLGSLSCEWLQTFTMTRMDSFQKPHEKKDEDTFYKFCDIIKKNAEDIDNDYFISLLTKLMEMSDLSLAKKFVKIVKGISLSKYVSENIDNPLFVSSINSSSNIELSQFLYKINPNILFSLPEQNSPNYTNSFLYFANQLYKTDVSNKNQEIQNFNDSLEDRDYEHRKERVPLLSSIEFLKFNIDENINEDYLYDLLFSKPLYKEVRDLGYTSNFHFLLNTSFDSIFGDILDDVFFHKYPMFHSINLKENLTELSLGAKISLANNIEHILEKTLFLPATEHSKSNYHDKVAPKNKNEYTNEEQMLNIFMLTNANQIGLFNGSNNSNNKFFPKLFTTYMSLLNDINRSDLSQHEKDLVLDKFSPNILNFTKNSLNGLFLYQANGRYSYNNNSANALDFINNCISFVSESGLYTSEELLDCFEQIQKTNSYEVHLGNFEKVKKSFYYLDEDELSKVSNIYKEIFIKIEHILLDMTMPQNNMGNMKKNKF